MVTETENLSGLTVLRLQDGAWQTAKREVPCEHPVTLRVNGRELVTLIASPHQLNQLVVGFLVLQGIINETGDLLSLGLCEETGRVDIRIRGEVPQTLRPILTSGCGTGVTFVMPDKKADGRGIQQESIVPADVITLMNMLTSRAECYRRHGGIHASAVGDGDQCLLFAEDIGRHNTIDRIAGEAFLKKLSLDGMMMATSGRISSEMVAKASQLGILLIASRTAPTDMAVRMCDELGITLVGYLRGESMTVYAGPERLAETGPVAKTDTDNQ